MILVRLDSTLIVPVVFKLRPRVHISLSSLSLSLSPYYYLSNHAWGRHSLGSYRYIIFSSSRAVHVSQSKTRAARKERENLLKYQPHVSRSLHRKLFSRSMTYCAVRCHTEHEHHVPGQRCDRQAPPAYTKNKILFFKIRILRSQCWSAKNVANLKFVSVN